MRLRWAFLASIAVAAIGVMLSAWLSNRPMRVAERGINHQLLAGVGLRDQIALSDVAAIRSQGYRTLIDLRPDGEAADQPPSGAVAEAAQKAGIGFAYIPTPRGDVPEATVSELARVLATTDGPILLYCRSGNRAARVWALAEASRADGPTAMQIASAAREAGQPVDDLLPQITARIAARKG